MLPQFKTVPALLPEMTTAALFFLSVSPEQCPRFEFLSIIHFKSDKNESSFLFSVSNFTTLLLEIKAAPATAPMTDYDPLFDQTYSVILLTVIHLEY